MFFMISLLLLLLLLLLLRVCVVCCSLGFAVCSGAKLLFCFMVSAALTAAGPRPGDSHCCFSKPSVLLLKQHREPEALIPTTGFCSFPDQLLLLCLLL